MSTATAVDVSKLRALYESNEIAAALLDHFAGRKRSREFTTLSRLCQILRKDGIHVRMSKVREVLKKELEPLGCGRYISGRWTKPSRFRWSVNLVELGKLATGEDEDDNDLTNADFDIEDDAGIEDAEVETLEHEFHLRPDFDITFELPEDLTPAEASRIAQFIGSLPFSERN